MALVGKCQIHIPHKENMNDWASQLGQMLFPDDPVKRDKLRYLAMGDRENWSAIERYLNKVAPQCFGGSGCGTPSVNQTVPNGNVVFGEDACAEGRNNTANGDKSNVSGENNDAENENGAIVGGEQNSITETNPGNSLDSVILGGNLNTLTDSNSSAIVAGETNLIADGANDAVIVGGEANQILYPTDGVVILGGADNLVAEGGLGSVLHGFGAVAWENYQYAHSISGNVVDTGYPEEQRSGYQYSRLVLGTRVSSDATPQSFVQESIIDYPLVYRVWGTVLASKRTADVRSIWSFEICVSSSAAGARFVGTPTFTVVAQDAGAATWSVGASMVAGGAFTNYLSIDATGQAATSIEWGFTLHFDEMHQT